MYWFAARGFWHVLEHLLDDFVDLRLWHRLFRRGEITLCLSFAKEKNGDVRDGSVVGTHAFRRLGFDTNRVGLNVQQAGDSALDLGRVWTNPGLGQDERGIYVSDDVSGLGDALHGFRDEQRRVCTFPFGIGGRKESANITGGNGTEQRIGQGVQQHVAIGMPAQSFRMGEHDATNLQGDPALKLV